jgi:hypothetical protein
MSVQTRHFIKKSHDFLKYKRAAIQVAYCFMIPNNLTSLFLSEIQNVWGKKKTKQQQKPLL